MNRQPHRYMRFIAITQAHDRVGLGDTLRETLEDLLIDMAEGAPGSGSVDEDRFEVDISVAVPLLRSDAFSVAGLAAYMEDALNEHLYIDDAEIDTLPGGRTALHALASETIKAIQHHLDMRMLDDTGFYKPGALCTRLEVRLDYLAADNGPLREAYTTRRQFGTTLEDA